MEHTIQEGLVFELKRKVEKEHTAHSFSSGSVDVYATPCLILQMEQAALEAVKPGLLPGFTTVGTKVNIEHCAPTVVGMTVTAKAVLKEIDGRRLVFDVEAWDDKEMVGKGIHERVIVNQDRFEAKAREKRDLYGQNHC